VALVADMDTLTRSARSQPRDQFASVFPGFYLVCAAHGNPLLKFITEPDEATPDRVRTPTRARFEVHRVAKARWRPFPDRISIGRARNCDIVLRHASISKLHAHFRLDTGQVAILDNNSRNGTAVNDQALIPERRVFLQSGDRIRLGTMEGIFLGADGLYDYLR
jgi:hypothetical protein